MTWWIVAYAVIGVLSAVEYVSSEAAAYGRLVLSMIFFGALTVAMWPLYWLVEAFYAADRITIWRAK